MISEKEKKIVAAVNASRGEPKGVLRGWSKFISVCIKEIGGCDKGGIYYSGVDANEKYWEVICTIEEYNQCIEEMARAEWMNSGVDRSYAGYKLECRLNNIDTSNKRLLPEKNTPTLYTQSMYDAGILAPIGSEVVLLNKDDKYYMEYGRDLLGKVVKVLTDRLPMEGSMNVQAVEYDHNSYCFRSDMLHPIKTPEQAKLDALVDELEAFIIDHRENRSSAGLAKALIKKGYIVKSK